jgi:thermostable 8-oxoguanine DNA glycosylase
LKRKFIRNTDFVAKPSAEDIELAVRILKSRIAAKRRQRISKYRTHIPTIHALLAAGNSLRVTCDLLRDLHGFKGSAAGLCRFLQRYPLLQAKSHHRTF